MRCEGLSSNMPGISCLMLRTDNLRYKIRRQSFDSVNKFFQYRKSRPDSLVHTHLPGIWNEGRHITRKKKRQRTRKVHFSFQEFRVEKKNPSNFVRQLTFSSILLHKLFTKILSVDALLPHSHSSTRSEHFRNRRQFEMLKYTRLRVNILHI